MIHFPHRCELDYLSQPDRPGIIVRCDCGQLWRSVHPGNPAYAGWRRAGPLYRLVFRKRIEAAGRVVAAIPRKARR
jgi:hypothetical protein